MKKISLVLRVCKRIKFPFMHPIFRQNLNDSHSRNAQHTTSMPRVSFNRLIQILPKSRGINGNFILLQALTVLAIQSFGAGKFINQSSPDITVIRAKLAPWSIRFHKHDCQESEKEWLDCTDFLDKYSGGPSVVRAVVSETALPEFFCRGLEIETAIRSEALKASAGIGFYYDGVPVRPGDPNLSRGRVIPVRSLKKTGWALFKNGEAAVIHRFIGLTGCWQGSATLSNLAVYEFKPFVEFGDPVSKNLYRNWESLSTNHKLSRKNGFSFDRSREVLR